MTTASDVEVREGTYGDKVIAVEPGGAEFIPLNERHGRPLQLFWTWSSPNMEFATIFVGVLAVAAFGLGFWEAVLAIVLGSALGFGTIGFFLAWSGLSNAGTKYDNFLLIIAYWIAPWLAVVFCDQILRRQPLDEIEHLLFDKKYANWAGPVAMAVGMGISIWLFSNQTEYVGLVPKHIGSVGDLTFEVGFVLTTVIYLTWRLVADRSARASVLAGAHARQA